MNIEINPFGYEETHYITNKEMNQMIDDVDSYNEATHTPSELIKLIHFNPEHPENQNIKIKSEKVYIYDGKNWNSSEKTDAINLLVQRAYNMIVNYYNRRKDLYLKRNRTIRVYKELIKEYPSVKSCLDTLLNNSANVPLKIKPLLQDGEYKSINYEPAILDLLTPIFIRDYFSLLNDQNTIVNLTNIEKENLSMNIHDYESKIFSHL